MSLFENSLRRSSTPRAKTRSLLRLEALEERLAPAVGQLRIASYNILNLPNTSAMTTVLQEIGNQNVGGVARPIDVLLLQEADSSIGGQAGQVRDILNTLYGSGAYSLGTLQQSQASGGDRQAIVYRNSSVNLLGEFEVPGASGPRAPMRYRLAADVAPSFDFYIYNSHYDAVDALDRLDEAQAIRANADTLGNAEILYVGDFNIDTSSEDMYDVALLGAGNGQAFDPINTPGSWASNSAFRAVHTQSTRTGSLPDGGASGGMDDRFDFILHTQEVGASGTTSNGSGLEFRAGSYRAFGNDNTHTFNGDITSGAGIYSATVRSALLNSSDHLPVVVDYDIEVPDTTPPTVASFDDGDADNLVAANVALTYTITFSEDILNGSFTAADLNNAGTATANIGTPTETSPGVFSVTVTPTSGGTLVLRIPTGSVVEDVAGNDLVVPVQDNDTLTVDAIAPSIAPANFVDDVAGGPVAINQLITYTLTFSEDILNGSFTSADLNNAGTASITVGTITETSNGVFSVQITPTSAGTVILRIPSGALIEDVVGNDLLPPVQDGTSIAVNAASSLLQVTSFTPTHSGFVVDFSRQLDASDLNLYDAFNGTLGVSDVTVTGPSGAIRGSLIVDPGLTRVTFVQTGFVLGAGSYTVTLRSAANGFEDTGGGLLDGDANGTAGGDYVNAFSVASSSRWLGLSDFARGAGQPVNLPATALGIPLVISDASGVTSLEADLFFDSALLTVPTGTFSGGPFGGTLTVTAISGGVHLAVTGLTGATGLIVPIANLGTSVPNTAPYASKQVLDLQNVLINGGSIPGRDDDAVQVAAYFADATASRTHDPLDATRVAQVASGLASGFAAYQLADPALIADVTGSGAVDPLDGTRVAQKAAGLSVPAIPDIPSGLNPPTGGPDPRLFIPDGIRVRPGQRTVLVPVRVENTNSTPISIATARIAVAYDPNVFVFRGATAGSVGDGSLGGSPFTVLADESSPGTLLLNGFTTTGPTLAVGQTETIFWLRFDVRRDAPAGTTDLNILDLAGTTALTNNEGQTLTLIPQPTDGIDVDDGSAVVRRRQQTRWFERRGGAMRRR